MTASGRVPALATVSESAPQWAWRLLSEGRCSLIRIGQRPRQQHRLRRRGWGRRRFILARPAEDLHKLFPEPALRDMAAERLRKLDVIVVTVYKVHHPLAQSGAVLRQGKLQHRQQHEYPRRRAALPSLHAYPSPSVTNIFRWGQAYDSNFFLTIYSLVIIIRWLSEKSILRGVAQLVARLVRDQEAGSSSLPTPTISPP